MTKDLPELPLDDSLTVAVRSLEGEKYAHVQNALKKLTDADKTEIAYFSVFEVQHATNEPGMPKKFSDMQKKLEELVSDGLSYKIVAKVGYRLKNEACFYRYYK